MRAISDFEKVEEYALQGGHVRLRHLADILLANLNVRLTNSGHPVAATLVQHPD
jgi:hypothetical protein